MEEKKLTGYPSIDKPWLKYYSEESIEFPIPDCSLYEYLINNNKDYPNDIAIKYFNYKITYKELWENIHKAAKSLSELGLKQGDIVTVALPSIPEAVYVIYAINKIGAVANLIHPLAGEQEIVNYLNEVNSRIFIMFTGTYSIIKNSLFKTSVEISIVVSPADSLKFPIKQAYKAISKEKIQKNSGIISYSEFISKGKNNSIPNNVRCPNMAIISHTGGTTGVPKGCMLTDMNIISEIVQVESSMTGGRQTVMLNVLPPFINYSLTNGLLEPLSLGITVVLIPKYEPLKLCRYISKYKPQHINSIPNYWETLIIDKHAKTTDFSCLINAVYGGEKMNYDKENAVNSIMRGNGFKSHLMSGYGMTELTSAATATYENIRQPKSVGIPLPKMNCKIIEPDTFEEKHYGEEGEICLTGPTLMIGYLGNPSETDSVIKRHSDGERWLHTGDIGYVSEDGMVFITGRIKRIAMTKGNDGVITKIFPERIEKVIEEHEAIKEVCVVAVKDEIRIHYPKAFIVLEEQTADEISIRESIISFCRKRLPGYMVPDEIEFLTEIPRTSRGKADYKKLEQM